jgi:hypothetical protein
VASNGEREKRRAKRRDRKLRERATSAPRRVQRPLSEAPRRKMSETLVDFAQPLLSRLPDEAATAERWYAELAIAALTWNGVVAGDAAHTIVARATGLFPRSDLPIVIAELIERKRLRFADDQRSVLDFLTYERGDRVHVTALSAR